MTTSFKTFLLATHTTKGQETIRNLPQEIRHKIWLDYAVHLSYEEVIMKEMMEILKLKMENSHAFENTCYDARTVSEKVLIYALINSKLAVVEQIINSLPSGVDLISNLSFTDQLLILNSATEEVLEWFQKSNQILAFRKHQFLSALVKRGNLLSTKWFCENMTRLRDPNDVPFTLLDDCIVSKNTILMEYLERKFPMLKLTVMGMINILTDYSETFENRCWFYFYQKKQNLHPSFWYRLYALAHREDIAVYFRCKFLDWLERWFEVYHPECRKTVLVC